MASTYTTRIKLEKQGDGENANTWGQRLNNNVIDLVDEAVAGYHTVNVEGLSGDVTLDDGDGNSANDARNFGLNFKGAMTSDVTIIVPAREKIYFLHNEATGGNVFIKPTGGTAVTVAQSMMVATSGTIMNTLTGFTPDSITADVSVQGNLFVSGDVSIGGVVSAPTIHATTKIHTPAISATNVSATTVKANTVSCVTLSATNVRATNVTATNIKGTTVSADVVRPGIVSAATRIHTPLVCATNIIATSIAATKIHAPNISATHVSATNAKISSNLSVGGNVSVGGTVFAPTVSATTVKAGSLLIGGETKDNFASGTKLAFNNSTAPTGWTIDSASTRDNAALRIVTTNGGGAGGSNTFTSKFNTTQTITISGTTGNGGSFSGTTGGHRLLLSQIPPHSHNIPLYDYSDGGVTNLVPAGSDDVNDFRSNSQDPTDTEGGSGGQAAEHSHSISISAHNHSFSDTDTFNFDVKYVDFIICEKD